MATVSKETNPFIRRSPAKRLADGLKVVPRLPGMLWRMYRGWPKALRYSFAALGIVSALGASAAAARLFIKRNQEQQILNEWVGIENEFRTTGDMQKIKEGLDRILAIRPDDVHAKAKRAAIESGQAEPSDAAMWMLIIRDHGRNQRVAELEREAKRRLTAEPRDYYANYLLAKIALSRNDLPAAEPHLAALAAPDAHPVNIQYDSLADAAFYLKTLGLDVNRLRNFIQKHITPDIRKESMVNAPMELQAVLLRLFLETFELPSVPQDAGLAWPNARRMFEAAFNSAKEKTSNEMLQQLGMLGPRMINASYLLKNTNQIPEAVRAENAAAIESAVRTCWTRLIEANPTGHEAYLGLVESYARTGQIGEAIETLLLGLDRCGDQPQLLETYWTVAMQTNTAAGYQRLLQAAERNPTMPRYWVSAARAASAMGRRDLAFEAIAKARQNVPDNLEVKIMNAVLYDGTGHPHRVLEHLAFLTDDDMPRYPHVCAMMARALAEVGDEERLQAFLDRTATFSRENNRPEPHYFAAMGLLESEPSTIAGALRAAEFLKPAADKWRVEFPPLSQLRARALTKAVDLSPTIDRELSTQAVMACERAATLDPRHLQTAADLVYLRIRTQRDVSRALSEIGPLLARLDTLTPEQAEVLGMAYIAAERYGDAVRVLLPYTTLRATAGCWIQLAAAYQGQGRLADAESALNSANQISMSPRERADYRLARGKLSKVTP